MPSYEEYYLNQRLPSNAGLGNAFWLLKLPHQADKNSGQNLLGSIVQHVSIFLGDDYPSPFLISEPQAVIRAIEATLAAAEKATFQASYTTPVALAGFSISWTKSNGLKLNASGTIPGAPVSISAGLDMSTALAATLDVPNLDIYEVSTGYLNAFSKSVGGNGSVAFPGDNIDDNYIVDAIAVTSVYSVTYKMSSSVAASIQASVTGINVGGGVTLSFLDDYTLKVSINGGTRYVIGLHVIEWDNLDS